MAKFCTKCGKPLNGKKVCDCVSEKPKDEEIKKTETNNNADVNEVINNLLMILKGTFKNPISTIKKTKDEKYFISGIITLVLSVFGIALFLSGILKTSLESVINKSSMTSAFNYLSGSNKSTDINVFGLWVRIVILGLLFYGTYTLIAWLITNKIMKKKNTYKEIIAALSVPTTISAASLIVAWLFVVLFGTTSAGTLLYSLIFSFGQILFTVYLYHSLILGTDVKEDYAGYTHFASIFAACIVIAITASIMISSYANKTIKAYTPKNSLFGYINLK